MRLGKSLITSAVLFSLSMGVGAAVLVDTALPDTYARHTLGKMDRALYPTIPETIWLKAEHNAAAQIVVTEYIKVGNSVPAPDPTPLPPAIPPVPDPVPTDPPVTTTAVLTIEGVGTIDAPTPWDGLAVNFTAENPETLRSFIWVHETSSIHSDVEGLSQGLLFTPQRIVDSGLTGRVMLKVSSGEWNTANFVSASTWLTLPDLPVVVEPPVVVDPPIDIDPPVIVCNPYATASSAQVTGLLTRLENFYKNRGDAEAAYAWGKAMYKDEATILARVEAIRILNKGCPE